MYLASKWKNPLTILSNNKFTLAFNDDWTTTKGWFDVDNYPLHVSAEVFLMMKYQLRIADCLNC